MDFGRAHRGRLLPPEAGQQSLGRARDRARPDLCAVRRPGVVGDLDARPRRGAGIRRRDPPAFPGQAAGLQLLAVVQLAGQARRRRPSPSSRKSWRPWATGSSSSRSPGFHALNLGMFELAQGLSQSAAWRPTRTCRSASSRREAEGFTAVRHQHEVGTGYFDAVAMAVSGGTSSTVAMAGSTENEQFQGRPKGARRRTRRDPALRRKEAAND